MEGYKERGDVVKVRNQKNDLYNILNGIKWNVSRLVRKRL